MNLPVSGVSMISDPLGRFAIILAISKKELKGLFDQPAGWILTALFVGVSYYVYFTNLFVIGSADIRPFVSIVPWIFSVFIPAVTMRSIASERRTGTLDLVISYPINEIDLILGKYFGALFFILLSLVATLTLPFSLALVSEPDLGVIAGQYFVLIMLAAAVTSLGIFCSCITRNLIVAYVAGTLLTIVLLSIGAESVISRAPYPLSSLLSDLSLADHLSAGTRGVIDLRDIGYFFALTLLPLTLGHLALMRGRLNKGFSRYKKIKYATFAIVIVISGSTYFMDRTWMRLDLTEQRTYSLSPGTVDILDGLEQPVLIDIFVSDQLPKDVELIKRDAIDILHDYRIASKGRVKLRVRFPDVTPEDKRAADANGIPSYSYNIVKQNEFSVKESYFGLSIKYSQQQENIPTIKSVNDLEYRVSSYIEKMSREDFPTVLFTAGHGEKTLGEDYIEAFGELQKRYITSSVRLDVSTSDIPSDARVVVVAGPTKAFSSHALNELDEYIAGGGSVIFMVDAVKAAPELGIAIPEMSGFRGQTGRFGFRINDDLIYDLESNETVAFSSGQNNVVLPYPMWIRPHAAAGRVFLSGIDTVMFPWISSITILDPAFRTRATPLFTTTRSSGIATPDPIISDPGTVNTTGVKVEYDIQPTGNSNFKKIIGTEIPAAILVRGTSRPRTLLERSSERSFTSRRGNIVIIGDSEFPSTQYVGHAPSNLAFFLNTIDWLAQDDALNSIRAKQSSRRALGVLAPGTRTALHYGDQIGVPLIVLVIGAFRLARRRSYIRS